MVRGFRHCRVLPLTVDSILASVELLLAAIVLEEEEHVGVNLTEDVRLGILLGEIMARGAKPLDPKSNGHPSGHCNSVQWLWEVGGAKEAKKAKAGRVHAGSIVKEERLEEIGAEEARFGSLIYDAL
jgi:hypothetical protein